MTSNAKQFIKEVSSLCNYQNIVDDNFNIVVITNGIEITISAPMLNKIFDAYIKTGMTREYALKKALKLISDSVTSYQQTLQ